MKTFFTLPFCALALTQATAQQPTLPDAVSVEITASTTGVQITNAVYVYAQTPTPASAVPIFDGWLFTTPDGQPRDWTLTLDPGPQRVVAIGADGGGIDTTIDVPMPGDLNGDGAVTAADLSIVLDGFERGTHTAADLSAVLDNLGGR